MTRCGQCGFENQPGSFSCVRCGAPLPDPGVPDEGARIAAMRAKTARRNMTIYSVVGAVVAIAIGYVWWQNSRRSGEAMAKLNFAERWAELDKRDTGLFWACIVPGEVDVRTAASLDQVQSRIESGAAVQANFSEHITMDCVPKLQHAASSAAGLSDAPAELKKPVESYTLSLKHLQGGIEAYAENLKHRQGTKDLDQLIQKYGKAWHEEPKPTPETIAFEKFLTCSIPGLHQMKDVKALLKAMAEYCYNKQKDPSEFMDRVTKSCGGLLQEIDLKGTPAKTYGATQKKFFEPDARMLDAWVDCGKRARRGRKTNDLGEFLAAFGEYMDARKDFGQKAKEISDTLK
jgi:hypothetical protein